MKKFILFIVLIGISLANTTPELLIKGQVVRTDGKTPLAGVLITVKGTQTNTTTGSDGKFEIKPKRSGKLRFQLTGFQDKEISFSSSTWINVKMMVSNPSLVHDKEVVSEVLEIDRKSPSFATRSKLIKMSHQGYSPPRSDDYQNWNTESYSTIRENIFHRPIDEPLSTFSIDVDAASYSNMRRFIMNGQRPPKDAIRIEELINYFNYDYPQPKGNAPFSVTTELVKSPWSENQLLHIGLQGKIIPKENLPASNLVFLIDVSGSMGSANKLPLLKSAFKLLVSELRKEDKVAIVVYAGAAGLVLASTPGDQKEKIMAALDNLQAGGSTAGGAGIRLAYNTATANYIEEGNNRVIIATDGDFNIGESSDASMERLIERERERGVFLTVLGFGMGNYKDSKMEILADKGNGNYAYIDTFQEANKVLSQEFGGTLFTIAKDVKIQIEFNPSQVKAYRLIGYVNRILQKEDFNDDKKDAGDLGSGHSVTALYEIILPGGSYSIGVDPLKYQEVVKSTKFNEELATVKLRYKLPNSTTSKLIVKQVVNKSEDWEKASDNLQWAATVAAFGMNLRESEFLNNYSIDQIISMGNLSKGDDSNGYRSGFIKMMELSKQL